MLKEKVARAIRQLKKGKTEYFDEIYDLTKASVYYVIRGVLKDNYLVEDAMQETYVAFLNSIARIDDEQNPLSYLLQIAKNKALDEARRMTRAAGDKYRRRRNRDKRRDRFGSSASRTRKAEFKRRRIPHTGTHDDLRIPPRRGRKNTWRTHIHDKLEI